MFYFFKCILPVFDCVGMCHAASYGPSACARKKYVVGLLNAEIILYA
jgi:hypothetical protein